LDRDMNGVSVGAISSTAPPWRSCTAVVSSEVRSASAATRSRR
jgi:hypothetical protein